MNASDAAAASSSGAVINPQFCLPYAIDFAFTTKPPGDKSCHLAAVDAAGNVVFKYKKSSWSNSIRLVDAAGHVLVKMKAKDWSMHGRWQAFAGDSTDQKDLLFSIKRSSILQLHDQWVVYLAANKKEEACDFTITGNYRKKNNIIYKGDSSFVVAQANLQEVVLEAYKFWDMLEEISLPKSTYPKLPKTFTFTKPKKELLYFSNW